MPSIFWKSAGLAVLMAAVNVGPGQAAGRVGWVWANQPAATGAYTPNTSYSYNSVGGSITVTPFATGVYEVSFGNLHAATGTDDVQVTPYDTNGYCTVDGWHTQGKAVKADVNCFDASGNPANTVFDLLYQERTGIFGTATKGLAFVLANSPAAASYTPLANFQYNSTGGTNTITRSGTGNYGVDIPGLSPTHSDVQISAFNESGAAARCKVQVWGSDGGTGTEIFVLCFDGTGAPADEAFDLAYAVNAPFGLGTATATPGAWAYANNANTANAYGTEGLFQYNGFATGKLTSQRTGNGTYVVNFPGNPSYNTSNVLVTAYGNDSSYCNSGGWYPIYVNCYAQGGAPIRQKFDVTYQTSR